MKLRCYGHWYSQHFLQSHLQNLGFYSYLYLWDMRWHIHFFLDWFQLSYLRRKLCLPRITFPLEHLYLLKKNLDTNLEIFLFLWIIFYICWTFDMWSAFIYSHIHILIWYIHRMSSEMVACIAVESLSILEKMHSRGYPFIIFFWIF